MNPKELLTFMREQSRSWMRQDVTEYAYTQGVIVEVRGTTARLHRAGAAYEDRTFYPSLAPYHPVVGDKVLCANLPTGMAIMGALNTGGEGEVSTAGYASLSGAQFTDTPRAATPDTDAYDDQLATTEFVKDVITYSPSLNDPTITGGNADFRDGSIAVGTPVSDFDAANKAYVDDVTDGLSSVYAPKANPTFTGTVTMNGATVLVQTPTSASHAASKGYVDGAPFAPTASPTFTGTVTVPTPTAGTNPTTKTYVDTELATKAPTASPTFTGTVTMTGASAVNVPAPSSGSNAATKTYVDGKNSVASAAGLTTWKIGYYTGTGTTGQGQGISGSISGLSSIIAIVGTISSNAGTDDSPSLHFSSISGNNFTWYCTTRNDSAHNYGVNVIAIGT